MNGKTKITDEFISMQAGQFRLVEETINHRCGSITKKRTILFQTVSIPTSDILSGRDIGKRMYICDKWVLGDIPEFNIELYNDEIQE